MAIMERITAVAVFDNRIDADQAVDDLRRVGFREDQIGIVARHAEDTSTEKGSKWEEGTVTGLFAGAGLGALVGLGIIAGIIPAIGPVIAGGALSIVLANAAGGAALAGIVGALVGFGIPEEEARKYEIDVQEGRTIVTVKSDGRFREAMTILRQHGGYDRSDTVFDEDSRPVAAEMHPATPTEARQLREEELHVRG